VPPLSHRCHLSRRAAVLAVVAALCCAAFSAARAARSDQSSFDTIGAIDGEAIAVSGSMSVEVANGQVKTILRSGSDVRVKSGQARIDLVEGGKILICGPAHFSVLKSAGSLTLALDFGVIHAHIVQAPALTIYTAQLQARPVAIGDGPQDILVGFDATGAMCIRASSGAVRLEQQLTAQNVIVPQGGDILVNNAQLDTLHSGVGHCSCEPPTAKSLPPVTPSPEVSMLATPEEIRKKPAEGKQPLIHPDPPPAPAREEPVYQVFMPPLTYDANAKVQAEFDPKLIMLVRRVRVRPTLIFQGRVEGEPVAVASNTPQNPSPADAQGPQKSDPKPAQPGTDGSMFARVRSFFRRLWTRSS
jgi:hypothetical protein